VVAVVELMLEALLGQVVLVVVALVELLEEIIRVLLEPLIAEAVEVVEALIVLRQQAALAVQAS
jgi:hypothetical protein